MPYPNIPNLELSTLATADLEDILQYTYLNYGDRQVDIYLNALLEGMELISENPGLGHKRADLPEAYKTFRVRKHILIYTVREQTVYLVRILHEKMDFTRQIEQ